MRKLVFDIEADGFKPKNIWCIVAIDVDSNEEYVYRSDHGNLREFNKLLASDIFELIGHNILGYDVPVLERLQGIAFGTHTLTDTLVL